MSDMIKTASEQIESLILKAVDTLVEKGELEKCELAPFNVEIPGDCTHGDFATNAAMVWARNFRKAPKMIADAICANIDTENSYIEKCEVAGPGFINFFVKREWFSDTLLNILEEKNDYGKNNSGNGDKVMVEFVSANPTGPMHMGNARGGGLGDGIAECMTWCGYDVTREFYVNDAGNQIEKFKNSLEARYFQIYKGEDAVEFPEDGYHGADVMERAKEFAEIHGNKYLEADPKERGDALIAYGLPKNIEKLRTDLEKYKIFYDVWFMESTVHKDGTLKKIIDILKEKGATYEKDGALWYKATDFGGDKDEVLIKANGHATYFTADVAYHYNKFAVRGFKKVINVWGADHHGHVARIKGAMDAIGLDGDALDIVLMQLVRLTANGEAVRMSKRTGKVITLSDLLDEVPVDAARFFFNLREPNSHLDFDLALAVEQSSQNPVYYVQYAHARICSIFKNILAESSINIEDVTAENLALLTAPEEISLIRNLALFTDTIIASVEKYDPSLITRYAIDLATAFHKFYNACRVKGEEESLTIARLSLCQCVKLTLENALSLLTVSAPDKM